MMQLPATEGGMAVPHLFSYYLAAQLQQLGGCATMGGENISVKIMLQGNLHNSVAEALEADSLQRESSTPKMITKVWQTVKRIMGYKGVSEHLPIWHNKYLHELLTIEKNRLWERYGVSRLIQLYEGDTLKSFAELRQEYGVPNKIFYSYLQIRHALGMQLRDQPLIWSKIPLLQKIIKTETTAQDIRTNNKQN